MTYQSFIEDFTTNDAVIEAVTVGVTLYSWGYGAGQDAVESGRIARAWWDAKGEDYAWAAIRYTAVALWVTVALLAVAAAVTVEGLKLAERTWIKYGTLDGLEAPTEVVSPVERATQALATVREYQAVWPERMDGITPREDAESLTLWAFANLGRVSRPVPSVESLLNWAATLK